MKNYLPILAILAILALAACTAAPGGWRAVEKAVSLQVKGNNFM